MVLLLVRWWWWCCSLSAPCPVAVIVPTITVVVPPVALLPLAIVVPPVIVPPVTCQKWFNLEEIDFNVDSRCKVILDMLN